MADSPRFNSKTFTEWKASRVNRAFFQYLRDTSESLARQWAAGEPMSEAQQHKAALFLELADLSFEDVATLYGIEDDTESAAQ